MSSQKTLKDSRSAISSQGSLGGPKHSGLQGGQPTDPSGQVPVPVSRFRALDSEKAIPIEDTCGPLFTISSPSRSLQWSLESRLRQRMDVNGSREYALTWKQQDMPVGVPICALRASGRRTSGKGFSGWPTPLVRDAKDVCSTGAVPSAMRRDSPSLATRLLSIGVPWFRISTAYCLIMGFPSVWNAARFMVSLEPSSRKPRQNSSVPSPTL